MADNRCPLFQKYFVEDEALAELICANCCPLSDFCWQDLEDFTDVEALKRLTKKRLEEVILPCPKCQTDKKIMYEVLKGVRPSTLRKNEDGDWQCWCGKILYPPPLKLVRQPYKKREK